MRTGDDVRELHERIDALRGRSLTMADRNFLDGLEATLEWYEDGYDPLKEMEEVYF